MTETQLPQRSDHAEHRDTRNIKRLLRAMRRDPSTLSVDEMSCVCAVARMEEHDVAWLRWLLADMTNFDAVTRARIAELVRAVGDE